MIRKISVDIERFIKEFSFEEFMNNLWKNLERV